jgi:succinyl-diaminopimelate desuccinylase
VGFPEEDAHERTVIGDNAIDRLTAGVETSAALRSIRGCLAGMNGIEITDLTWTRGTYEPLDAPTVEFGFGTQTAHGTDEYTTTEELVRNATAYAILPQRYASHEPAL